jgi:hypothetical protein
MSVRHVYDGALPSALKGSCATLLSPPQCHAALGTIPQTLTYMHESPVCHSGILPLSITRMPRVGFWRCSTLLYCLTFIIHESHC